MAGKKPLKIKLKFKTLYDAIMSGKVKPFKGKKDSYLDLTVWVNSEKDDYGRFGSVAVDSNYLANEDEKVYVGDVSTNPFADEVIEDTPQTVPATEEEAEDDLPF